MSAPSSRGRGRGRGMARATSARELSPDEDGQAADQAGQGQPDDGSGMQVDDPAVPTASTSAGPPRASMTAGPSASPAPGGASLLRKNVYTGANKMKFTPTMVKRKPQAEPVQVKEEEVEPSLAPPSSARGSGRGRGRGRGGPESAGRGRGRGDVVMTASGAFAFGPAAQERKWQSISAPRGEPGGRAGRGRGGSAAGGGSMRELGGHTSTAALVDSDPEDYEDGDDEERTERKNFTTDLYDIGLESEMAPLVLPRDEKKWKEEEALRSANERAMGKLKVSDAAAKVKMDPYMEEEMAASSLAGTPVGSASATPVPVAQEQAADSQDAAVLGAEDVKITVKREDVSQYFNMPKEEASHEQFYVFQFPRLFPQFVPAGTSGAGNSADVKPSGSVLANALKNEAEEVKHKVRSAYHESEAEAWREYQPGKWQGWGKNPGREERDVMGAGTSRAAADAASQKPPEGQIGKIKIRRSGKITMKLGGTEFEILPGAPTNFLQEIVAFEERDGTDEDVTKGMFVMGQALKKFVITPELAKLLRQDAKERQERARQKKEEEEMRAKKAKEEAAETKLPAPLAQSSKPKKATARRAAPAAPKKQVSTAAKS